MSGKTATYVTVPDAVVAAWNERYPIGTPVHYWRGVRHGKPRTGATRTAAQALGGHTPVVWIAGTSGAIGLTHVQPLTPTDDDAETFHRPEWTPTRETRRSRTTPAQTGLW
ncbi:hypothetical protein [Glycomyces sp. YM15]|uniref:hypothetical protein n=1 Tax=Glycomyces sp. YM15 TaxID=2800446 RepID=UPI0019641F05|nr:hypothetical protein [Glycomyces sp. YM15]